MGWESLESRQLLAAIPFGADSNDTAEFMLGDVLVTLVLFESDGTLDANTETWTHDAVSRTKETVRQGLSWWEDLLDAQETVHDLDFQFDFTYTDRPVATKYEPISRTSDDFVLWIDDFFARASVQEEGTFKDRIRAFNHQQRVKYGTHWAFTILLINSANDTNGRFETGGAFLRSFAFAGGVFFVTLSDRPASSVAHEAAHMFWAMDEYAGGGKAYQSSRGYYNTQNSNATDGHPDPESRVTSIMDSHAMAYPLHAASPSSLESIGWRDSDGNGVFDVLDVPHLLMGTGTHDPVSGSYRFQGRAEVQPLPNQNSFGLGNDITLNRINEIQYRFDTGRWQTASRYDAYEMVVDFAVSVPAAARQIEVRAVDLNTGVTSNLISEEFSVSSWQNRINPMDVDENRFVTPLDALLIINELNANGSRLLTGEPPAGRYLDTNGDRWITPLDALFVINQLNEVKSVSAVAAAVDRVWESFDGGEGESDVDKDLEHRLFEQFCVAPSRTIADRVNELPKMDRHQVPSNPSPYRSLALDNHRQLLGSVVEAGDGLRRTLKPD